MPNRRENTTLTEVAVRFPSPPSRGSTLFPHRGNARLLNEAGSFREYRAGRAPYRTDGSYSFGNTIISIDDRKLVDAPNFIS